MKLFFFFLLSACFSLQCKMRFFESFFRVCIFFFRNEKRDQAAEKKATTQHDLSDDLCCVKHV